MALSSGPAKLSCAAFVPSFDLFVSAAVPSDCASSYSAELWGVILA